MSNILGLDVSTVNVGLCQLNSNGNILLIEHLKLNNVVDLFQKSELIIDFIKSKNIDTNCDIVMESCLLNYRFGFSNTKTIMSLVKINTLVNYLLYKEGYNVINMNVNHARKVLGFKKNTDIKDTKKAIDVFLKTMYYDEYRFITSLEFKKKDDIFDAFILAKAFFLERNQCV